MTRPPVGILGAGSFGRGLAAQVERAGGEALIWSRTPDAASSPRRRVTTSLGDLAEATLIFIAVPSPHVEAVSTELGRHLDGRHMLVHVSRGLVGDDLQTISERLRSCTPSRRVAALAGPLVADAMERGDAGGAIVGTRFLEVAEVVRDALASEQLRIYDTRDIIGVEFASAMVGLLSLAIGFARGLDVGPGPLGVFATRGIAEAIRLSRARGAQPETFSGLAGFGDLLAAVAGDGRPELRLGRSLATEGKLQSDGKHLGAHIEGIDMAHRLAQYGKRMGVDAPITDMISAVLRGDLKPREAIARLMARRVGTE